MAKLTSFRQIRLCAVRSHLLRASLLAYLISNFVYGVLGGAHVFFPLFIWGTIYAISIIIGTRVCAFI